MAKVADDTLARSKAWPIAPVAVHKRKTKSKSLRGTEDFEKKKKSAHISAMKRSPMDDDLNLECFDRVRLCFDGI